VQGRSTLLGVRRFVALFALAPLLAGCSSSSSGPALPKVGAAKTYALASFRPAGTVLPRRPTTVTFSIAQPSGAALTAYKTGAGPHTGIHLIVVRDDLSLIIHRHPPIGPDGRVSQRLVFPEPGRYRVIVDSYPRDGTLKNFQLYRDIRVGGSVRRKPIGPYRPDVRLDGFRFAAPTHPRLLALQGGSLQIHVSDAAGRPARFVPWYGALAHAIFFHAGSLDYFHTHVCGAGASACASSVVGGPGVVGHSAGPGVLDVGVLLPSRGVWRMFLQAKPDGRLVTVPYTLRVT
jgi:hypothetical protein